VNVEPPPGTRRFKYFADISAGEKSSFGSDANDDELTVAMIEKCSAWRWPSKSAFKWRRPMKSRPRSAKLNRDYRIAETWAADGGA
jgi:hypothetical protein